jgi:hypothetical protein
MRGHSFVWTFFWSSYIAFIIQLCQVLTVSSYAVTLYHNDIAMGNQSAVFNNSRISRRSSSFAISYAVKPSQSYTRSAPYSTDHLPNIPLPSDPHRRPTGTARHRRVPDPRRDGAASIPGATVNTSAQKFVKGRLTIIACAFIDSGARASSRFSASRSPSEAASCIGRISLFTQPTSAKRT